MLALTQPALAKIIYTPSNILIKVHGGIVDLDLNHDGINDFSSTPAVALASGVEVLSRRKELI